MTNSASGQQDTAEDRGNAERNSAENSSELHLRLTVDGSDRVSLRGKEDIIMNQILRVVKRSYLVLGRGMGK